MTLLIHININLLIVYIKIFNNNLYSKSAAFRYISFKNQFLDKKISTLILMCLNGLWYISLNL